MQGTKMNLMRFCHTILFIIIYLFLERGEGKKKSEININVWFTSRSPYWGPGLQLRHVPWLVFKLMALGFTIQSSIHWATLARSCHTTLFKNFFLTSSLPKSKPSAGVMGSNLLLGLGCSLTHSPPPPVGPRNLPQPSRLQQLFSHTELPHINCWLFLVFLVAMVRFNKNLLPNDSLTMFAFACKL